MESAFHNPGPDLRLIETFRADAEGPRLERHLARMARSAARLGWRFDLAAAKRLLRDHRTRPLRARLTLDPAGGFDLTLADLPPRPVRWQVIIAQERLRSDDPWLTLKTTRRPAYDAARATLPPGVDEAILLNEQGELCDGTITTIFFDRGQGMATPPLTSGLLPGILREEMIAQGTHEDILRAEDLGRVRLWVGNSLRGLIPAQPYSAARDSGAASGS